MKIAAVIGLLFFIYCTARVVSKWEYRTTLEKAIWFIIIAAGSGWCIFILMR